MKIPNTFPLLPLASAFTKVIPCSSTQLVSLRRFTSESGEVCTPIGQRQAAQKIMDAAEDLLDHAVEPAANKKPITDIAARLKDISYQMQQDPHLLFDEAIVLFKKDDSGWKSKVYEAYTLWEDDRDSVSCPYLLRIVQVMDDATRPSWINRKSAEIRNSEILDAITAKANGLELPESEILVKE